MRDEIAVGLFMAVVLVGTLHAFALRTTVFGLDSIDRDRWARRRALRVVKQSSLVARRRGIGIGSPMGSHVLDGGLIDINNASVETLTRVAYLHETVAERIVCERTGFGEFVSVPDVEVRTDLDPRCLDAVRSRLIFLPMEPLARAIAAMRPSGEISRADGRQHGPPLDPPSRRVIVMSWIWAMCPLISGSLLACPVLAYGAARLRSRWLWITSTAFLFLLVACMVVFDGDSSTALAGNLTAASVGGAATVVAVIVRKRVFEVDSVSAARQQRRAALQIVTRDPAEAIRLRIGRIDVPADERYPDGGLIDVNNVPLDSLRSALCIDHDTADRIVEIRKAIWGFEAVFDLCSLAGLSPQHFKGVDGRLILLPPTFPRQYGE